MPVHPDAFRERWGQDRAAGTAPNGAGRRSAPIMRELCLVHSAMTIALLIALAASLALMLYIVKRLERA